MTGEVRKRRKNHKVSGELQRLNGQPLNSKGVFRNTFHGQPLALKLLLGTPFLVA